MGGKIGIMCVTLPMARARGLGSGLRVRAMVRARVKGGPRVHDCLSTSPGGW